MADLPLLFDAVDPEALDKLVADGATVRFDYAGFSVSVTPTGVTVS